MPYDKGQQPTYHSTARKGQDSFFANEATTPSSSSSVVCGSATTVITLKVVTLMGSSFTYCLAATDTVQQLKQRIHRTEGIAVHQQHLVYRAKELRNSWRLCDAGVENGATVQLVVAMKGGPIVVRRLNFATSDHQVVLRDLKELLDSTVKDDVFDDRLITPTTSSKVSVLVFRDGDILNLLRIVENEDGSYSAYNEKSPPPQPPPFNTLKLPPPANIDDNEESNIFQKLFDDSSDIREDISTTHQHQNDYVRPTQRQRTPPLVTTYKLLSGATPELLQDTDAEDEDIEIALKDKHRVRRSALSLYTSASSAKHNYLRLHNRQDAVVEPLNNCECQIERLQQNDDVKNVTTTMNPKLKSKPVTIRCAVCNRRLNVTNRYDCRCGGVYCAPHRYAEVHQCNYDYKTEGRRLLEYQNPLVTAQKIHKI